MLGNMEFTPKDYLTIFVLSIASLWTYFSIEIHNLSLTVSLEE